MANNIYHSDNELNLNFQSSVKLETIQSNVEKIGVNVIEVKKTPKTVNFDRFFNVDFDKTYTIQSFLAMKKEYSNIENEKGRVFFKIYDNQYRQPISSNLIIFGNIINNLHIDLNQKLDIEEANNKGKCEQATSTSIEFKKHNKQILNPISYELIMKKEDPNQCHFELDEIIDLTENSKNNYNLSFYASQRYLTKIVYYISVLYVL